MSVKTAETQRCWKCDTWKPLSEFYNSKARHNGKTNRCKTCSKKDNQKWQKENPERYKARYLRWRKSPGGTATILLGKARQRATAASLPFTITKEDVLNLLPFPELCPIAGIPIKYREDGLLGPHVGSPSLDRVIPEKGYVPGNIAIISWIANQKKSDLTKEYLLRMLDYINSYTGSTEPEVEEV